MRSMASFLHNARVRAFDYFALSTNVNKIVLQSKGLFIQKYTGLTDFFEFLLYLCGGQSRDLQDYYTFQAHLLELNPW